MKISRTSRRVIPVLATLALFCGARVGLAAESAKSPPGVESTGPPATAQPARAIGMNLILNGDLENTSYAPVCAWNQDNASVTAGMANITAFGTANEIDVLTNGSSCGFAGPPASGNTKFAIHSQGVGGPIDAFSFQLAEPVVAGNHYSLSFYAWAVLDYDPDIGAIEIGLSGSADNFGTLVFSGTPTTTGWTLLTGVITASVGASYLTVRSAGNAEAWNHIDNFTLENGNNVPTVPASWGQLKARYNP